MLAGALSSVFLTPLFVAHAGRLLGVKQLCSRLFSLLLPGIPAMAVGLQLPPERRPSECTWRSAADMAGVLSVMGVTAGHQVLAAQPEAATRLLHAAVQLLQHCPLPALCGAPDRLGSISDSSLLFITLLGTAVAPFKPSGQQQPDVQLPLSSRLALQLLAALPRIGEALAAAVQPPYMGDRLLEALHSAANSVVKALAGASRSQDSCTRPALVMAAVEHLPAWLRGAATALRWLPLVEALAAHLQQTQAGSTLTLTQAWPLPSNALAQHVTLSGYLALQQAAAGPAAGSPALQSECLDAWWQLHTASCRLVHWALADGMPPVLSSALDNSPLRLTHIIQYQVAAATELLAGNLPPTSSHEGR